MPLSPEPSVPFRPSRGLLLAALLAGGIGVTIRLWNAFRYPALWGFDAGGNWLYVQLLTRSWTLPDPSASWSTAHPPLFYYTAAALLRMLGLHRPASAAPAVRLLGVAAGLAVVFLAARLVQREAPERRLRALLAAGCLLFLPAQILMSAMFHEEMMASLFTSLAVVGAAWSLRSPARNTVEIRRAVAVGACAGLALLTKLSGVLALGAVVSGYAIEGWRRRALRLATLRITAVLTAGLLMGGWYYARSWERYATLYPHGLSVHRMMFQMPPGERSLTDYLRVPLATWTDPQLLSPSLLHSVWGSTYATVWFDGHRHFLSRSGAAVRRAGTAILLLALLPTLAFLLGMARRLGSKLREPGSPDAVLLPLVGYTLLGYCAFAWVNPWYVAVKGTYLLGLSVPFAFYASEILDGWLMGHRWRKHAVAWALALLALLVTAVFTYGLVFTKHDDVGLPWRVEATRN